MVLTDSRLSRPSNAGGVSILRVLSKQCRHGLTFAESRCPAQESVFKRFETSGQFQDLNWALHIGAGYVYTWNLTEDVRSSSGLWPLAHLQNRDLELPGET